MSLNLVEKNGVFEFENISLRNCIKNVANEIFNKYSNCTNLVKYFKDVEFDDFEKVYKNKEFCKISLDISKYTEWIKCLDLYVCLSEYGDDAFSFDYKLAEKHNFFKINENNIIEKASIIIAYCENIDYYSVIMHELKHLFVKAKFLDIWRGDSSYSLNHRNDYDINLFTLETDVNLLSNEEIHCIITESMYYANFSEQHAFMETINIEIENFFKNTRKFLNPFHNKEMFFMKSSKELYNIYILENLVKQITNLSQDRKISYHDEYKNVFDKGYYNFNDINKILNYIYKKLHKIILHSRKLFNYYWDKNEIDDIYNLNENVKLNLIKGWRYLTNRTLHN